MLQSWFVIIISSALLICLYVAIRFVKSFVMERRNLRNKVSKLSKELENTKTADDNDNKNNARVWAAANHDLMQPLNAARLYASSLKSRLEADDQKTTLKNIELSLELLEDMIDSLALISKLDAGSYRPHYVTFSVSELLEQIKAEFTPIFDTHQIELSVVNCSHMVTTDKRLLKRILQNFASNAAQYASNARVLIGCRSKDGNVEIQVHDTGQGISETDKEIIFKEFQRGSSLQQGQQGLGLGLSIVDRIAKMLNLELNVDSNLAKGSVFSVKLPVAKNAQVVNSAPLQPIGKSVSKTKVQCLCVDNEPQILDGMQELLSSWGYDVIVGENFDSVKGQFDRNNFTPDVMLVDYHLDEGNGLHLIDKLRELLGHHVTAVLVTADRSDSLNLEASEKRVSILSKPVKPAALRAFINSVAKNTQSIN